MPGYDVVIIGAGVIGAAIARELSKYKLSICVIEKENDVATGSSSANSGIVHAGFDAKPGTLMGKLNVSGNYMFDMLSTELGFRFRRNGSLVLAFTKEQRLVLDELMDRGNSNGVPGLEIVPGKYVKEIEPLVNDNVIAALYAPTGGIVCPYDMTIALAENAAKNGVEFRFSSEVISIDAKCGTSEPVFGIGIKKKECGDKDEKNGDNYYTDNIRARYVINAAGLYADIIAKKAGAGNFVITPRKGEYCVLDKNISSMLKKSIKHTLFNVPGKYSKGVLITPTVDGNIMIGPNARDIQDKEDTSTTGEGIDEVIRTAGATAAAAIPINSVIKEFAGLRAVAGNDFVIGEAQNVKGFINVAGICSPGLTAAPAIAEYVVGLLSCAGLALAPKQNPEFQPTRLPIKRFNDLDNIERQHLIDENPAYGNIVCRCEMVSEAEIIEAIRRPCGATSVDGVKRRVRAGMGRCQGGFCMPRIIDIIARETTITKEKICKDGDNSYIISGKIR